jgi:hypothetical protein
MTTYINLYRPKTTSVVRLRWTDRDLVALTAD